MNSRSFRYHFVKLAKFEILCRDDDITEGLNATQVHRKIMVQTIFVLYFTSHAWWSNASRVRYSIEATSGRRPQLWPWVQCFRGFVVEECEKIWELGVKNSSSRLLDISRSATSIEGSLKIAIPFVYLRTDPFWTRSIPISWLSFCTERYRCVATTVGTRSVLWNLLNQSRKIAFYMGNITREFQNRSLDEKQSKMFMKPTLCMTWSIDTIRLRESHWESIIWIRCPVVRDDDCTSCYWWSKCCTCPYFLHFSQRIVKLSNSRDTRWSSTSVTLKSKKWVYKLDQICIMVMWTLIHRTIAQNRQRTLFPDNWPGQNVRSAVADALAEFRTSHRIIPANIAHVCQTLNCFPIQTFKNVWRWKRDLQKLGECHTKIISPAPEKLHHPNHDNYMKISKEFVNEMNDILISG